MFPYRSHCAHDQHAAVLQINSFTSWKHLANQDALIKLVPAVGATAALLLTLKHSRNPFVLPVVLVAIPAIFHIVLVATGTSLQQAADAGWLMQPEVCSILLSLHTLEYLFATYCAVYIS